MNKDYPLLVKGFFSDQQGNGDTIPPTITTASGWANTLPQGRGNTRYIDVMKTAAKVPGVISPIFTVSVAGVDVLSGTTLNSKVVGAYPGSYLMAALDQPAGQTIQLNVQSGGGNGGIIVHTYFQNGWDQPAVWDALKTAKLKTRYQDFFYSAGSGIKGVVSPEFTVPVSKGNVVAIQLLAEDNNVQETSGQTTLTVSFNGIQVIENALAYLGVPECARPGLVFPFVVPGGSTFNISADTSRLAVGQSARFGVRLYFDDQLTGSRYPPVCE